MRAQRIIVKLGPSDVPVLSYCYLADWPTGSGKRSRDCDVDGGGKEGNRSWKEAAIVRFTSPLQRIYSFAPRLACHEISAGSPWSDHGPDSSTRNPRFFRNLVTRLRCDVDHATQRKRVLAVNSLLVLLPVRVRRLSERDQSHVYDRMEVSHRLSADGPRPKQGSGLVVPRKDAARDVSALCVFWLGVIGSRTREGGR